MADSDDTTCRIRTHAPPWRCYCSRGVLQCVAVCCSVLQCVAVCCSELQCVAVCCSVLPVYCSVLQCVASVLQCVAVCCSVVYLATLCCTVLHCVAACCNSCGFTLQDGIFREKTSIHHRVYFLNTKMLSQKNNISKRGSNHWALILQLYFFQKKK